MKKKAVGFGSVRECREKNPRLWHREMNHLEITEAVCTRMNDKGVSRRVLARRLKWSVSKLDKCLDGDSGFLTLPNLLDIAFALGADLKLFLIPERIPL